MSILALQKKEILQLLKDYNLTDYVDEVKEWYDGSCLQLNLLL